MANTANITALPGQTLLDLALQHYGDASAIVRLCMDNGYNVGDKVAAGAALKVDTDKVVNKQVVAYYAQQGVVPATAQGGKTAIGVYVDDSYHIAGYIEEKIFTL